MRELLPRAERIAAILRAHDETIAVAESSSGGLIAAALLAVPGASSYFVGAGVVYTRRALIAFTRTDEARLNAAKPGTQASALERARIIRECIGTTWGLSETGVAGPAPSRYGYPPGHSCVGVSGPIELAQTIETGSFDRVANMYAFASGALELLEDALSRKHG